MRPTSRYVAPRAAAAAVVAVLAAVAGVLALGVTPARASAYRYWSYYHAAPGSATWTFAGAGATYRPSPGAVEGWRFAVSPGTASAPAPRADPATAYNRACSGATAAAGQKLVALVVDYGTASDAPPGEKPPGGVVATCTTVAANADGFDVLRAAHVSVREQGGLVCGLDGYPRTECAPLVMTTPSAAHSGSAHSGGTHTSPAHSAPAPSSARPSSSRPTDRSPTRASARSAATATASRTSPAGTRSSAAPSHAPAGPPSSGPATSPPPAIAAAGPSLVVGDVGAASGHGSPWPFVGGIAVVAVVAGGAWAARRRA